MASYTQRERIRAINLSAFLGFAVFALEYVVLSRNPVGLVFYSLYGVPLSFVLVWLLAGPLIWLAMRHAVTWPKTFALGFAASAIMAAAGYGFRRWMRSRASENSNFAYKSGGGDYVSDIDGILTPYGQWLELQGTIRFVLIGIVIALVVRMIVGPAGGPDQSDIAPISPA